MSSAEIVTATSARRRATNVGGLGFHTMRQTSHVAHVMVRNQRGGWIVEAVLTNATAKAETEAMEAAVFKWNRSSRRQTVAVVRLPMRDDARARAEVEEAYGEVQESE